MSTKSREVIYGGQIIGAKIRAQGAREVAKKAVREADRAAAEAMVNPDGSLWRPRAAVANHRAVHQRRLWAGYRSNAIAARPRPASRWMPSGARAIHRSGNWKRR